MSRKDDVWEKGKAIRGKNPDVWRKDAEGNKIKFGSYGTEGKYSWQMDHEYPKSKGGGDGLKNLQPLQTQANRAKSDKLPKPTTRRRPSPKK